jgi:hypothetical protein
MGDRLEGKVERVIHASDLALLITEGQLLALNQLMVLQLTLLAVSQLFYGNSRWLLKIRGA